MPAQPTPHALLLAAGAGRRFGHRPKALIQRDGQPLLQHLLHSLARAGLPGATVVLGHHAERLAAALPMPWPLPLKVAYNPRPDDGQNHSLHQGLHTLPPQADVLVLLCDLPLLTAADIGAVLQAWARRGAGTEVLVPRVAGQRGHPVVFSASVAQALQAAGPAQSPRDWMASHPGAVAFFDSDNHHYTADADTPEDLARLAAASGLDLQPPSA